MLEVFGKIRRQGRLCLVLVLPDGSRSHIPAEWTDFPAGASPGSDIAAADPMVASVLDLWRCRQRVDALLRRTQQNQREGPTTATVVGGTHPTPPVYRELTPEARRRLIGQLAQLMLKQVQANHPELPNTQPRHER